ncbi:hypothetical protein BGZ79_003334 [Entomortierella chlamydospora]|nr:hypothetical protein BGZ79_003334 [Entomortierella chlamydospora]
MIKSILSLAAVAATMVSAQTALNHISFTQPVGDGITYVAGSNQTFSWTMACTAPSTLVSATPNATEVDFMDSNNINNAFYVKKVGTIDCTKSVGNLVWTVPADTKPGVYALQLLLTPNNAYSGRFNVTVAGGSTVATSATASTSNTTSETSGTASPAKVSSATSLVKTMGMTGAAAAAAAGAPFDSEVSTADLDSEAFATTPSATTPQPNQQSTEDMDLDMLTQLLDPSSTSSSKMNCATDTATLLSDPSVIAMTTTSSSSWTSSPSISPLVLKLESPLLSSLDDPETPTKSKSKAKGKASSTSSTTKSRKRSSDPLDKEAKARERVLRNRAAAQESRDKKRKYVADIEASNELLQEENCQLLKRLKTVESDNLALSQRLEALTAQFTQMQQLLSQSIKQNQPGVGFCQSAVLAKKDKKPRQTDILTNSPQQKLAPHKGSTAQQTPTSLFNDDEDLDEQERVSEQGSPFVGSDCGSEQDGDQLSVLLQQHQLQSDLDALLLCSNIFSGNATVSSAATGHSQHGLDDDGVPNQHPATADAELFDSFLDLDWSAIEQSAGAAAAAGGSIFYPAALLEPSTV